MAVKKGSIKVPALSEEYVVDSTDEEDNSKPKKRINASSRQSGKPSTQKKVVAKEASPSSEAQSSEDSEEEEVVDQIVDYEASEDEDEADQDEESGEASGDDDEGDQGDDIETHPFPSKTGVGKRRIERVDLEQVHLAKKAKTTTDVQNTIPAKPFAPPKGFEKLALSTANPASPAFLSESGTKQLWYFTAPPSLSLESLGSLDMEAVLQGQPVIKQDGISYVFAQSQPKTETLLLSEGKDGHYVSKPSRITKTFSLQQTSTTKTGIGALAPSSPARLNFAATTLGEKQAVRAQPEGLRMRYQPFGSGHIAPVSRNPIPSSDKSKMPTQPTLETPRRTKKHKRKEQQEESGQVLNDDLDSVAGVTKSIATPDTLETNTTLETLSPSVSARSEVKERKKKKKKKSGLVDEAAI